MSPVSNRSSGPLSIVTFRDAVGLAMAVADDFAFANVAALIRRDGTVADMAIAEGIGKTIEPLVAWAVAGPVDGSDSSRWPEKPDVMLLSVRPFEVDIIREQDLLLFRTARWVLAGSGLGLVDWIETDGDLFRSYAYVSCPTEAWPGDPPTERYADQRF